MVYANTIRISEGKVTSSISDKGFQGWLFKCIKVRFTQLFFVSFRWIAKPKYLALNAIANKYLNHLKCPASANKKS